jgi:large subunit ribosomal protein L15
MSEQSDTPILSRLRPAKGAVRDRRRKGRGPGSGLGKTAGHGQKGQKARHPGNFSKLGFEGGQMPLFRRLPKRGFSNPFAKRVGTVNVKDLARFDAGTTVDEAALRKAGLVKGNVDIIKVLGDGELDKALTVRVHAASATAAQKIQQAGGSVELLATTAP